MPVEKIDRYGKISDLFNLVENFEKELRRFSRVCVCVCVMIFDMCSVARDALINIYSPEIDSKYAVKESFRLTHDSWNSKIQATCTYFGEGNAIIK